MTSVIEPNGVDTVSIPIISDLAQNTSSSKIILAKSGNVVVAEINSLKANATVGSFTDRGVIPVGFRPMTSCNIAIANLNTRSTPGNQEVIKITFQTNGNIDYYNYTSSTLEINSFPSNTFTYITSE